MKTTLLYITLLITFISYSQVGVGTTNPQAMLDVNGDLRVQTVTNGTVLAAETSVLIVDDSDRNIVKKVPSKYVVNSYLKSLVKGSFLGGSSGGIAVGLFNWSIIPFNNEDIDENDEYDDASNYKFTAKQDGVYEVYSQIKVTPVSAGDFGIGIIKEVSGTETILAQDSYVGVSVLGINVSSPYRRATTLISLNAGESIKFKVYSLVSVTLAGGGDSFFTIKQVR
jgi:hypothetical protein